LAAAVKAAFVAAVFRAAAAVVVVAAAVAGSRHQVVQLQAVQHEALHGGEVLVGVGGEVRVQHRVEVEQR
jgi:hypothetical protein